MRDVTLSDRRASPMLLHVVDATLKAALYNQLVANAISALTDISGIGSGSWMAFAEICQPTMSINTAYQSTSVPPLIATTRNAKDQSTPASAATSSNAGDQQFNNIVVNMLVKPAKSCPDFKDDADQVACCESRINKDSFFCCTREQKAQLQWEVDKEAWRQFAQDHLPSIIIGSLFLVLFFLILTTFLCKRFTFCPLYRPKSIRSGREIFPQNCHHRYSLATGRYHRPFLTSACNPLILTSNQGYPPSQSIHFQQQAASIIHKTPAMYEAPPPYEFMASMPPPSLPPPPAIDSNTDEPSVRVDATQQRAHEFDCLLDNEINNIHQSIITENCNAN